MERRRKVRAEKETETKSLIEAIYQALKKHPNISDREKQIIKLRYGLEDYEERTLEEVGDIFEISRERVRQIQERVIEEKLPKYFLDHPEEKRKIKAAGI